MKHKIRASSIGKIIPSEKSLGLTPKQEQTLKELQEKGSKSKTLDELLEKQKQSETPKLSQGAKTHIQNIWYGEKFNFQKSFTNKFTQKGNIIEDKSIKSVTEYLGFKFAVKNERFFENDYCHGTPDLLLGNPNCVIDTKNVYFPDGLKFFSNDSAKEKECKHDYEWQIKSYLWLTKKQTGFICRILMNPPAYLIEREVWTRFQESGEETLTDDFRARVYEMFDFESKLPTEERVNLIKFELTQKDIDLMIQQVELMNEYWIKLDEDFKNKNRCLDFFKVKNMVLENKSSYREINN